LITNTLTSRQSEVELTHPHQSTLDSSVSSGSLQHLHTQQTYQCPCTEVKHVNLRSNKITQPHAQTGGHVLYSNILCNKPYCSLPLLLLAVVMYLNVIFTILGGIKMAKEVVPCSATIQSGLC